MKSDFFLHSNFQDNALPSFGFKIHVSATVKNYQNILSLVLPFLDEKLVSYKYIAKKEDIYFNFSAQEDAGESGKLITIYPRTREHCLSLLEELYTLLPKDLEGIYILSDRNYKDSKVLFYRYGCFILDPTQTREGHPYLLGPNDEEWIDRQKVYFDLPAWIDDLQEGLEACDSYISSKYEPVQLLQAKNSGNIYQIVDQDAQVFLMKEARANILSFEENLVQDDRENEFVLTQEKKLSCTPQAIEKVNEWIYTYYIYEFIEGKSLYSALTQYGIFHFDPRDSYKNAENLQNFLKIIRKLLLTVQQCHHAELVISDLHTDNFIYTPEEEVYLVDLENSYTYGTKPAFGVYNQVCLKEWNDLDGKQGDIKKIGNLILFSLAKLALQSTEVEELENTLALLDALLGRYAVESNLSAFIRKVLSDHFSTIDEVLEAFDTIYVRTRDKFGKLKKISGLVATSPFDIQAYLSKVVPSKAIYENASFSSLKFWMDREENQGLAGLAGLLLCIKDRQEKYLKAAYQYGMELLLSNLIDEKGEKLVRLTETTASPYMVNGSAGVMYLLLQVDPIKHKAVIEGLSKGLHFYFAQRPGYSDGMLGIADIWLRLYEHDHQEEYLVYAEELLLNTLLYVHHKFCSLEEFIYVYQRLIQAKQVSVNLTRARKNEN